MKILLTTHLSMLDTVVFDVLKIKDKLCKDDLLTILVRQIADINAGLFETLVSTISCLIVLATGLLLLIIDVRISRTNAKYLTVSSSNLHIETKILSGIYFNPKHSGKGLFFKLTILLLNRYSLLMIQIKILFENTCPIN